MVDLREQHDQVMPCYDQDFSFRPLWHELEGAKQVAHDARVIDSSLVFIVGIRHRTDTVTRGHQNAKQEATMG